MSPDPMEAPRCVAWSRTSGDRCKRWPAPGQKVCASHGAASPQAKAAAAVRLAEAEATALYEQVWSTKAEPVTSVVDALYEMAGQLKHALNVLGARVNATSLDGPDALAWARVMREQRQLLVDIERLGLDQRRVEIEEQRLELMATALDRAFEAAQLDAAQRTLALEVLFRELRAEVDARQARSEMTVVRGELE